MDYNNHSYNFTVNKQTPGCLWYFREMQI